MGVKLDWIAHAYACLHYFGIIFNKNIFLKVNKTHFTFFISTLILNINVASLNTHLQHPSYYTNAHLRMSHSISVNSLNTRNSLFKHKILFKNSFLTETSFYLIFIYFEATKTSSITKTRLFTLQKLQKCILFQNSEK